MEEESAFDTAAGALRMLVEDERLKKRLMVEEDVELQVGFGAEAGVKSRGRLNGALQLPTKRAWTHGQWRQ